jgi:hypothetical protein
VVTEPIESLMPKILKRYNNHPGGWNFLIDYKGNILILGPNEGYMLKMIPLNPQKHTGVGMKVSSLDEIQRLVGGAPSYGFRPLSTRQTESILDSLRQGENQHKLISKLLEKNPISIPDLEKKKPQAVLSGPFIGHPDLSSISKSQKELEAKLKIEALKLFKRKYPYRASIYG